jgi:hypothetical protein
MAIAAVYREVESPPAVTGGDLLQMVGSMT